jgi:integrase
VSQGGPKRDGGNNLRKEGIVASITRERNGGYQIQFVGVDKRRRSVRLGTVKPKMVEMVKLRIEQMVANQKAGVLYDPDLTQWLNGLADRLHDKLARVGLVAPRKSQVVVGLKEFLDGFIARRTDVKPATHEVWRQPARNLVEHFGANRDIATISEADALDFRQYLINSKLAPATVAKRLQFVRSFFHDARRRKLIPNNPFAEVSSKSVIRLDQRRFVTQAEAKKLLDACPNHHWRTIVALARYGGLRCPSEVLSLRWQDVDWDKRRIVVPSPKTVSHGKESRVIPLFPELQAVLEQAWEITPEGSVYVVDERYRKSANTASGWRNCNLRTTFKKIVKRAGLQPWPKLFHALRSSRETELAQEFPIHVVTAWLGNTPSIALRHYLLTTDGNYDRATAAKSPQEPAVQIPVQQGAEVRRNTTHLHNENYEFSAENGTLPVGATRQGGGHGTRTRNRFPGTTFPVWPLANSLTLQT